MGKTRRAFHSLNPEPQSGFTQPVPQPLVPQYGQDSDPYRPEPAMEHLSTGVRDLGFTPQPGGAALFGDRSGQSDTGSSILSIGGAEIESIPSIPSERTYEQTKLGDPPIFRTMDHAAPPLGDAQYEILDGGISGPDFLRLSMYSVPTTGKLRQATGLPLGFVSRPFAKADVPLADFSTAETPRCARCRAFVNPFMRFTMGGNHYVCNLCQHTNDTPAFYHAYTDSSGHRVDWKERPELSSGTYDLELPPEYGKGRALQHLFLVDVSRDAVRKGLPELAITAIRNALYGPSNTAGEGCLLPDTEIAIVAYDRQMHYFRFSGNDQIEMLEDVNLQEPFVPSNLFVHPEAKYAAISNLLDKLPSFFEMEVARSDACFGTALRFAHEALKNGGRASIIMTTLPSTYPGKLVRRESAIYTENSDTAADPTKELFVSTALWYGELAKEFQQKGVGLDLFAFPTGYIDIANVGQVAQITGGTHRVYPQYTPTRDARTFMTDLIEVCSQPLVATQALFKVRTSAGLQFEKLWGHDPDVSFMDANTVFAGTLVHDGTLDHKMDVHIQTAVLYTTPWGSRRLRISNLPAAVSTEFKTVQRYVDADTVLLLLARQLTAQMYARRLTELRTLAAQKVYEIFAKAREKGSFGLPSSQFLVPAALRSLLPLSLALTKIPAFSPRAYMSDTRVQSARLIDRMTTAQLSLYLYPRIYGVHTLHGYEPDTDFTSLPTLAARRSEVPDGGSYIIFNGMKIWLYLTPSTPQRLLQDLLGVSDQSELNAFMDGLPEIDTELSRNARQLCEQLAQRIGKSWVPMQLARQDLDGAEHHVRSMLVEDADGGQAYADYVRTVHHQSKSVKEYKWF